MTYNIDFVIHGHHEIEIEADNYEDAVDMAEEILSMQDFGALNYEVDTELYSVENEEIVRCIMEIKDLFQKFYPNAEFKIMELCPYYDSAKSFYGKAKVIEIGNDVFLVSYTTVVAFYNRETKIAQVVGTFSPTTLRHIKEFLRQSGFKAETKKQIMKDYM